MGDTQLVKSSRLTFQQAICAKRDQWNATKSITTDPHLICRDSPVVTIQKMAAPSVVSNEERSATGFRESLRFFQKQEKEDGVHYSSTNGSCKKIPANGQKNLNNGFRASNSAPSIDIILSNVRSICATKNEPHSSSNTNEPVIKCNGNSNENFFQNSVKLRAKITPIIHHPRNGNSHPKSQLLSTEISNCNGKEGGPLSSRFNPKFEPEDENISKDSSATKNGLSSSDSFSASFEKAIKLSSLNYSSTSLIDQSAVQSEKCTVTKVYTQRTESDTSPVTKSVSIKNDYQSALKDISGKNAILNNVKNTKNHIGDNLQNGNFDLSMEKLSLECQRANSNGDLLPESKTAADLRDKSFTSEKNTANTVHDDVADDVSEKACNSLESDYDSKDFIVHKTSFSEDYVEVMSEDACSSITEDYEVEHPDDLVKPRPDVPSPDYVSEEDDGDFRIHQAISDYEDDVGDGDEFIDNSSQYVTDPRRYIYYPDDKELEVIPEEDEDDLEDDEDSYNPGYSDHERDDFCVPFKKVVDCKTNTQVECDSGVTDDQRSTSSGVDDFYLEDDTDSAKGSLQTTSASESPVQVENNSTLTFFAKETSGSPIPEKWSSRSWDMTDLLAVLYSKEQEYEDYKWPIKQRKESFIELISCNNERMALSFGKLKDNYLYLNCGSLSLHEGPDLMQCRFKMPVIGAQIIHKDNGTICVRHQRREVVFRAYTLVERTDWLDSLRVHAGASIGNHSSIAIDSSLTLFKDVLVVDVGGTSIRAGILSSSPTLPALFFPSAVTVHKENYLTSFGTEAFHPNLRSQCDILHPFSVPDEIEFRVEIPKMLNLIRYICIQLNIEIQRYKLLLCIGIRIDENYKYDLARTILNNLGVKSICVTHETIAALHGYQQNTGIVVDAGDRIDVFPIVGGYLLSHNLGHSRFGAKYLLHHLRQSIARINDVSLDTESELCITRYILEQLCFVAHDYEKQLQQSRNHFKSSAKVRQFFQKNFPLESITLDADRFQVPEGLFQPSVWGYDTPGISELFRRIYSNTPLDDKKELVQNIFLSGGLTLLPGFPERLEKEISKFTPPSIQPKVHASRYRYHMAYIGCHHIASSPDFESMNVTWRTFEQQGISSIAQWKI